MSSKSQRIDLIRVSLTLFAITAAVAVLLAVVNYFTAPVIALSAQERLDRSLNALMPDAVTFEELDGYEQKVSTGGARVPVAAVYAAKSSAGEQIGYCVEVTPSGYSDAIDMIVAIDASGAVSGVQILSISDTPGIGMRVNSDTEFQESVYGLTEPAAIVKSTPLSRSEVQVISGASISSSAYINGVNAALLTVQQLGQGVSGT